MAGAAWCLARIGRECRAARRLRADCAPLPDGDLSRASMQLARALGLSAAPELLATRRATSPLLLGGPRPAILLPRHLVERGQSEELRLMLAHELAHLARSDLRWGWLRALAHAIFFFHPLVWLAGREWRLAQEMACDELALAVTGAGAGTYGEMLLNVAAGRDGIAGTGWSATAALGIAEESSSTLKRRLNMLSVVALRLRRGSWFPRAACRSVGLAVALGAGVALVPWRVTAQESPKPPAPVAVPQAAGVSGGSLAAPQVPAAPAPGMPPAAAVPRAGAGAAEAAPLPGLADQWEDVLLLEAMRYVKLSPAQREQVLPLARGAEERLKKLAEQEQRTRAALAQIARENREALLAGRPGSKQSDAITLERSMRQRRAQVEAEIVEQVLPKLARILTRDQIVRAALLTLGEPVKDRNQVLSAALLDPASGFVLGGEVEPPPGTTLAQQARDRIGQVVNRWEQQRDAQARQALASRYPQDILKQAFSSLNSGVAFLSNADNTLQLKFSFTQPLMGDNLDLKVENGASSDDPRVAAARQELEALRARTQAPKAQVLSSTATLDDLLAALRPFTRRMFLSPRLRPVLSEKGGR